MVPSWGSSAQADDWPWLARTTHTYLLPQKATVRLKPMARHSQPMRLPGRRAKTTAPTVAKAKKAPKMQPHDQLTGGEPVVGQQEPNHEPLAQDDQRPQAPGEPGCRARTEAVASRRLHDTAPHRATLAPCRALLCDDVAALPPPYPCSVHVTADV